MINTDASIAQAVRVVLALVILVPCVAAYQWLTASLPFLNAMGALGCIVLATIAIYRACYAEDRHD